MPLRRVRMFRDDRSKMPLWYQLTPNNQIMQQINNSKFTIDTLSLYYYLQIIAQGMLQLTYMSGFCLKQNSQSSNITQPQ